MRKYVLQALTPAGQKVVLEQIKEREAMGWKDKVLFNANFEVKQIDNAGLSTLEFTGKTRMLEMIDPAAFTSELRMPFSEAGCEAGVDYKIVFLEVEHGKSKPY